MLKMLIEVLMKGLIKGFRKQRIRWRNAFLLGSIVTTIVVLRFPALTTTSVIEQLNASDGFSRGKLADQETDTSLRRKRRKRKKRKIKDELILPDPPPVPQHVLSSSERHALSLSPQEALAFAKLEFQQAPEVVNDTEPLCFQKVQFLKEPSTFKRHSFYGPLPHNVARKMTYVQHMKSSKYCLCPMGYEVNSPRIVEAIYYECVPVIIADNFVLPFSELLDWSAFSVVVLEKEIPRLKEIILEIPMRRYAKMLLNVKMVQRHLTQKIRQLWTKPHMSQLFI